LEEGTPRKEGGHVQRLETADARAGKRLGSALKSSAKRSKVRLENVKRSEKPEEESLGGFSRIHRGGNVGKCHAGREGRNFPKRVGSREKSNKPAGSERNLQRKERATVEKGGPSEMDSVGIGRGDRRKGRVPGRGFRKS